MEDIQISREKILGSENESSVSKLLSDAYEWGKQHPLELGGAVAAITLSGLGLRALTRRLGNSQGSRLLSSEAEQSTRINQLLGQSAAQEAGKNLSGAKNAFWAPPGSGSPFTTAPAASDISRFHLMRGVSDWQRSRLSGLKEPSAAAESAADAVAQAIRKALEKNKGN